MNISHVHLLNLSFGLLVDVAQSQVQTWSIGHQTGWKRSEVSASLIRKGWIRLFLWEKSMWRKNEDCWFRSLQKREAFFCTDGLSLKQMIYSFLKGMEGKVLIRITFPHSRSCDHLRLEKWMKGQANQQLLEDFNLASFSYWVFWGKSISLSGCLAEKCSPYYSCS